MKTGAAYIRVSTEDQTEYSPDAQLREIKKYAAKNGVILDEQYIFLDEGISGRSTKKRDDFNRMIGLAKTKPHPFETILLWKFSRFARNQEEAIVYKNMLRKEGIDVVSVSEPVIDGPFGTLIERIIEWMDEYYSINLSGEVTRGMTEKALRGEVQTIASFGYDKRPEQPMTINPDEAKYVRYVFEQYLAGVSMFTIAGKLNTLGVRTKRGNPFEARQIEYMLNNPIYKGFVRWTPEGRTVGKRVYNSPDTITAKSTHPPIIDETTWNRANEKYWDEKRKRRKGGRPAESKKHYLSGILKCGNCGSTLSFSQATSGFQCIKYAHGTCKPSHYISAAKIEAAVLEALEELSLPDVYIENIRAIEQKTDERELQEAQIAELTKMFTRAKNAYLAGLDTIEEYSANKSKIQSEIDEIKSKIKPIKRSRINQKKVKRDLMGVLDILKNDSKTVAEKNIALAAIVEKIVFSRPDETLQIYFYR